MYTEVKACIYWERDAFCASSYALSLFFFLYNTKSAPIPFTHKHVSLPLSFTRFYTPRFCWADAGGVDGSSWRSGPNYKLKFISLKRMERRTDKSHKIFHPSFWKWSGATVEAPLMYVYIYVYMKSVNLSLSSPLKPKLQRQKLVTVAGFREHIWKKTKNKTWIKHNCKMILFPLGDG